MDRLIKISGRTWNTFNVVSSAFMVISVLVIITNIILRRFFNAPMYGSTEMVQYAGLIIASLAIVETEWSEGNVTMTVLVDLLPVKARNILLAIQFTINTIVFVILDYLLINDFLAKLAKGTLTSELKMPRWIFSLILAVGFIAMTLVLLDKAIIYYNAIRTGERINFFTIGKKDAIND